MPTLTKTKKKERNENAAQQELRAVIKNLRQWKKEIDQHHEEIAVRNFSIGLEVTGFFNSFPARNYPGMDLTGKLAKAVSLSSTYLSLVTRIVRWLYEEQNVRNIRTYMSSKKLKNWSQIIDHYFISQGKSEREMVLAKRLSGAISSLTNLRAALPRKRRSDIDRIMGKVQSIAKPKSR